MLYTDLMEVEVLLTKFFDGILTETTIPQRELALILQRSFRGVSVHKAWNFCRFSRPAEVLQDPEIATLFYKPLVQKIKGTKRARSHPHSGFRLTITSQHILGWAFTGNESEYPQSCLESRSLNRGATAQFVRLHSGYLAPLTRDVTIAGYVRQDPGQWAIVIYSMYPGPDVGKWDGDMTESTKRVWFDSEHPGEPLPKVE